MSKIIPVIPCTDLYIQRAQVALDQLHYDQAIHDLTIAGTLAQKDAQVAYIASELAVVYETIGDYRHAIQILKQLPKRMYTTCPELLFFSAEAYSLSGNSTQSVKYLERYLNSKQPVYLDEALALKARLQQNWNQGL
ncbi:hypothetical protein FC83_GL001169 [Agrilactobacillus composti DSM 18527 = JCM 14202]|uniref:Tetratrico peptide repeat group 5 domain-containing protein n=1 Tax=Agrilactobacillus composti DSM 18527 = JCM 14202 TaxID=1423734 RepID=X0QR62_9LACO|nr:hypothetical protein [Agrilactobacillus composti]KRM31165.1 hypothetical protein FC83_GL001169 [Agrilactobacillus composti DSM 18527 = JCM 14202]GAF41100.1 hypothetical protein JCM14202_3024 [Agrilactobacillus composti DSM 18527 = JCM 14202]